MPKQIPKPNDLLVKQWLFHAGYNRTNTGKLLKCSLPTVDKKIRNPHLFTLNDIILISAVIQKPVHEVLFSLLRLPPVEASYNSLSNWYNED